MSVCADRCPDFGLACYLSPGHAGEHQGYLEAHDEVIFWRNRDVKPHVPPPLEDRRAAAARHAKAREAAEEILQHLLGQHLNYAKMRDGVVEILLKRWP